jgi:hypothetical protein
MSTACTRVVVLLAATLGVFVSTAHAQEEMSDEEILAALEERPALSTGTGVVGRVVAADTGDAIIEGQVLVVGRSERALTNLDGYFAIDLPPGEYTLRSFYELFESAVLAHVVVEDGSAREVEISLRPDASAMEEEVVVEARADVGGQAVQQAVRREATVVRDAISREEMARSPDGAASDAARRVVATSVVDGQYLYVRGLGGRYTNVLLEGSPLPSLDPIRPGVQLDLFPSDVLSSISVIKTYTPELPGNFAGGTMLLETREFPEDFELTARLGLGVNLDHTFRSATTYDGGDLDWLGFDDGTRDIPAALGDRRLDTGESLTSDEANELGRAFPNRFLLRDTTALPNMSIGVGVGDRLDLDAAGERYLGYALSVGYGRDVEVTRDESIRALNAAGEVTSDRVRDGTRVGTRLAALGSVSWAFAPRNDVSLTSLFNQSADDYASRSLGALGSSLASPTADRGRSQTQQFVARTLSFTQLAGDHRDLFGGTRLRWRLSYTYAERAEPDTREVLYAQTAGDGDFVWQGRNPGEAQRLYTGLTQETLSGGLDHASEVGPFEVTVGGAFAVAERDYSARRFRYRKERGATAEQSRLPVDQLFAPELAGEAWRLVEFTEPNDSYLATESTYAAYAMAELPVFDERLRLVGGVRAEGFRQTLDAREVFGQLPAEVDLTRRTDVDLLPAANAIVAITDEMAIRVGYSATVARPQIRELAPTTVTDYIHARSFYGDPTLQRSLIQNLDLRWEFFPGAREVIAVSVFAKVFDDPIELVIISPNQLFSYQNVASATNLGFEYEVKLELDRFWALLSGFRVGGNLTLVASEVSLTEAQREGVTSPERPLVGQAPVTVNASIGYAPSEMGLEIDVLYNVAGRQLFATGANFLADIYEEPFHSLDLVVGWQLAEQWRIKAAARNLLHYPHRFTQGGIVQREYQPGTSVSLQLGWTP